MRSILMVDNRIDYFLSHRAALVEAAQAAGWPVEAAVLTPVSSDRVSRHSQVPVTQVGGNARGPRPIREMATFGRLRRLFAQSDATVIHLFTIRVIFAGLIAAATMPRNTRKAIVCSMTGLGYLFTDTGPKARLLSAMIGRTIGRLGRRLNAKFIFQNADDRDLFERRGWTVRGQNRVVESSGVDTSRFKPTPLPTARVVMFGARYLVHKGVREFIAAARSLKSDRPGVRFVLVGGTDPDNPASVDPGEIAAAVAEGIVEDWGYRTDMPEVYPQASVFVLPSWREGFPKVALEAAACARPVITTDVPGCRQSVDDGVTGLLVQPRNDGQLAAAIGRLLDDSDLAAAMGRAGRARVVSQFSAAAVAAAILNIYPAQQ